MECLILLPAKNLALLPEHFPLALSEILNQMAIPLENIQAELGEMTE